MAKVTKLVDKLVPSIERTQVFTDADAATGDILDIVASIGRPARKVVIEATGGDLTVRPNVVHKIYPRRTDPDFDGPYKSGPLTGTNFNIAAGVEKIDETMGQLDATPSLELTGPVKDLEVTWTSGSWVVTVY